MRSARAVRPRSAPRAETRSEGAEALLLPLGLLLAVALPYVVFSTMSDQVHHEARLFAQAAAGAAALAALLFTRPAVSSRVPGRWRAVAGGALALAVLLALASAAGNHAVVDPLAALAFLSPLALFLAGASDGARRAAPRLLGVLAACGAASGLLAFGQRFLGLPRLPVQTPQPRFFASALIGNPGEMAAALVLPAAVLWAWAFDAERPRRHRLLAGAGFAACALGLGAAEAMTPILALGAGLVVHALLAPRRRLLPLAGAALVGAAVLAATGAGARAVRKARQVAAGDLDLALTQRDIGLAAGLEMVRAAPLFGFGPGAYENAFAPARVAAERRHGHRFVHTSESAHFENAHCEPLTMAAEEGIPSTFVALVAFGALAVAVLRMKDDARRDVLAPALLGFSVLALGSFPLRMPASAGAFALVAGLAWRAAGGGDPLPQPLGARRALLAGGAALLVALGGARLLSAVWQARGEAAVRLAATAESGREDLLAEARSELARAIALRPRSPSPYLALGSCERLGGDLKRAWQRTARSFALEERAETDLDLGIIAFERGDTETAHPLFVRAVWLLPRLVEALDESYAPGAVELDVSDAEARVAAGGDPPALPPAVDALRLRRRFP